MTRGSAGLDIVPANSHDPQTIPVVPRITRICRIDPLMASVRSPRPENKARFPAGAAGGSAKCAVLRALPPVLAWHAGRAGPNYHW